MIHHGDCLEVMAGMEAGTFDAIVTDPPYCSGGVTENGRGSAQYQGLRSETMKAERFSWFPSDNTTTAGLCWLLRAVAVEGSRLIKPSGSILFFADWRMVPMIAPAVESAGWRYRSQIVWDKGGMGCGTGFRPAHECVLHFTKSKPTFHSASVGNLIRSSRVHSSKRGHPTEKPIDLMEKLISVVCPPGGLVLDPFAGSGTTGVAARNTGRRAVLIEREAEYVEMIRARLQTGEAIYLTADQVEAHRAAGWTVEPFTHHHGAAGYWLATREA